MKSALHILLIEDSPLDSCLIERELRDANLSFRLTLIENESDLRRELTVDQPDLILSDHNLPSFDGFTALKIVRERFPMMPFIFVSGSNDQQMVYDMFDRGATDYVFKRDINDLRQAVHRALDDSPKIPSIQIAMTSDSPSLPDANRPGHLIFCPICFSNWDETGQRTFLEEYLGSHPETFVVRQVCVKCGKPNLLP